MEVWEARGKKKHSRFWMLLLQDRKPHKNSGFAQAKNCLSLKAVKHLIPESFRLGTKIAHMTDSYL